MRKRAALMVWGVCALAWPVVAAPTPMNASTI